MRHALHGAIVYLIHVAVLIGIVWCAARVGDRRAQLAPRQDLEPPKWPVIAGGALAWVAAEAILLFAGFVPGN